MQEATTDLFIERAEAAAAHVHAVPDEAAAEREVEAIRAAKGADGGALGERALPAALLPFRQRRVIAARSASAHYRRRSCRFGNGASLRRDMLFWNCGIVKMSHYGIVALRASVP